MELDHYFFHLSSKCSCSSFHSAIELMNFSKSHFPYHSYTNVGAKVNIILKIFKYSREMEVVVLCLTEI